MNITVVGAGYVGLVSGVCLASVGHHVTCVEVIRERVASINQGKPPIYEPGLEKLLSTALANGHFRATGDLHDAVSKSEVTIIAVGTPCLDGNIDLSYVKAATEQVGRTLRHVFGYHLVVIKSTVVPGTTSNLVRRILEQSSGRSVGEIGLCMNPEFLREGSAVSDFMEPDRIVIGQWDERSGKVLADIYSLFTCPKLFTTLGNAELIKYSSNALLATLISFSNEIAALCEVTLGADVNIVMDALHLDRRLSPVVEGRQIIPGALSYLRAGCGFGGSCLPKDVSTLRAYAREIGLTPVLLDAVMSINTLRPTRMVALAEKALGELNGRTLTVLGMAFKPGTDDVRDSPAIAVFQHLLHKGAIVRCYDPMVQKDTISSQDKKVLFCDTAEAALSGAEAALICTAWPQFISWDWTAIARIMRRPVIVDGRNLLRAVDLPPEIVYLPVGVYLS
jgi:UDPglucose 6-dehydrogenase